MIAVVEAARNVEFGSSFDEVFADIVIPLSEYAAYRRLIMGSEVIESLAVTESVDAFLW
jgi:hypothetical protein